MRTDDNGPPRPAIATAARARAMTEDPAVGGTYTVEDVCYLRLGARELWATLYRPRSGRLHPAVVSVHGGAWNFGGRLSDALTSEAFAAAGILVMAIDFRMPPEARYPTSIADVNLAIRWLKSRAERLGTTASRVGGVGYSSGGHQLLLAAMRPDDPRYAAIDLASQATLDATLRFAVLGFPIADPLARYRMAKARGIENLVRAHDAYWPSEAAMDEGSPQRMLDRGENVALPPILILQGDADENVTEDMAERFERSYRAAGGAAELRMYAGAEHGFLADRQCSAWAPRVKVARDFVFAQCEHA